MNHQENPDSSSDSGLLRFRSAPSSLFSDFPIDTKSGLIENPRLTHFDSLNFIEEFEEQKPNLNGFSSKSCLTPQYPKPSCYGALKEVGKYRLGHGTSTNDDTSPSSSRFRSPLSFSSGLPSSGILPQISEIGIGNVDSSCNESTKLGHRYFFGSWRDSSHFHDSVSVFRKGLENDGNLFSSSPDGEIGIRTNFLSHHLSLPKASPELAAMDKFLHFEDTVPCKVRAKRGCATHPRSIAERVRRTRISERMRKLQELVPNMDKQTNTAEMLDLAVEYIKDLQKQYKILSEGRVKCKCSSV